MARLLAAVTCSATIAAAKGGYAAGSATMTVASPTAYAAGSATIDGALIVAALEDMQLLDAEVRIGGEAMTGLVGAIELNEQLGTGDRSASFTLVDERLSYFHPDSLTDGEYPVEIDVMLGKPGATQTYTEFSGTTQPASAEGPDVLEGTIRAGGLARGWMGLPICIEEPAMSGKTRIDMIVETAEALGVPIVNAASLRRGRQIYRKVSKRGLTLPQLIDGQNLDGKGGWGELEGIRWREAPGGGIEILYDADFDAASAKFTFDNSVVESARPTPPAAPALDYELTCWRIVPDTLGAGGAAAPQKTQTTTHRIVDAEGKVSMTVTDVTFEGATEIRRVVTEWATFRRGGVSLEPEFLQVRKRTTTTNEYVRVTFPSGASMLTTNLARTVVVTEEMTGIPCGTAYGFAWLGGGRFLLDRAYMLETQEQTLENTYDAATCSLVQTTSTVKAYFTPLYPSGYLYPDGSYRFWTSYQWLTVNEGVEVWAYTGPGSPPAGLPTTTRSKSLQGYLLTGTSAIYTPPRPIEGYGQTEYEDETWTLNLDAQAHQHTLTKTTLGADGTTDSISEPVSGDIPLPPHGSETIAQYATEVIPRLFVLDPKPTYLARTVSEVSMDAESEEDLRAIYERRIRWDELACPVELSGVLIPNVRPGDIVTVNLPGYGIDSRKGMVFARRPVLTLEEEPSATQATTVRIPREGT